ncbi:MAG: monodechloroaminopyrrolnitrin synthase PrnB family protein [Gaiella sp.]
MTAPPSIESFDGWIRTRFRDLNTELEERYFALENPADVDDVGLDLKAALREEGDAHVEAVATLPLLDLDAERGYDLLGNVGLYMAALRRHELTNPEREERSPFPIASGLAQRLATGLGVVPRFATAHVNLSNLAHDGVHKSFTWLRDEMVFIEYNCLSILAFIRAADVLRRVPPLGVTHPISVTLFRDARAALEDVIRYNDELDEKLDVDRFFFNVRPYFKPYRVGRQVYRGANAGDFAAINEVDLMLGLCRVGDPSYAALVLEKVPFMTVDDQRLLQACVRMRRSLMDDFLEAVDAGPLADGVAESLGAFLDVCDAHGRTAAQHHDQFVARFIEQPAGRLAEHFLRQITASGPPLPVLLASLRDLRDKRLAAPRDDIPTRHADLARLREACGRAQRS